jgi:hypothetical protein
VARFDFEPDCPYCEAINLNDANASSAAQLPAIVSGGKVGYAADFDGVDDKLTAKMKATDFVADTYSWSLWVKPDAETLKNNFLTIRENLQAVTGLLYSRTMFSAQQQRLANKYSFRSSFDNTKGANAGAIVAGQWNHVVFTYGVGRQKTYVNGVLVANTARTKPMVSKFTSLMMGGENGGTLFKGLIDEFMIFNTELNQTSVTALFNQAVN